MSTLAQLSALVGALIPILIAVLQKTHFSRRLKTIIGAVASLAVSLVTPAVYSHLSLHSWGTSIVYVWGAALVTYMGVWVPLGAAPWIEKNINGSKPEQLRARNGVSP